MRLSFMPGQRMQMSGGDDVERRADGADAAEQDGEGPVVGAVAGREDAGR